MHTGDLRHNEGPTLHQPQNGPGWQHWPGPPRCQEPDAVTDNLRRPDLTPKPQTRPQVAAEPVSPSRLPNAPRNPHRAAQSPKRKWWMAGGLGALFVAGGGIALITTGGASEPAICTALADGKGALLGTREVYGAAGTVENSKRILTEAAATVRQSCPQFEDEAGQMDALINVLGIEDRIAELGDTP